jgi:hypothetical protein
MDLEGRSPETVELAGLFAYGHLPPHLQAISRPCHDLAELMIGTLPDGMQLTAGLWDLLRAKDCLVRAAVQPQKGSTS